jgi:ABC-2 type transport system permease protein
VLAAKAAVFAAVAFTAGLAASLTAFVAGQAIFARQGIHMHPAGPGALRPVLGAALNLTVFGLAALGLGALIRRTAGTIAILITVVIFLPITVGALPATWQDHLNPYLPSVAGQVVIGRTEFTPPGHLPSPWTGFAVFCGYAAAALIAAAIALTRRDA